ncbi:MAG TPA: T9SS type A sorting domain-containing protein [Parafilimonas sp.]|nr:T9SS type A sorting domain-containing protein [Parafilimonas sp.]
MKLLLTGIFAVISIVSFAQLTPPNIQWQKSLGGSGSDYARSIEQTTDSGYIIAGSSSSHDGDVTTNHGHDDYWVVKLKKNGAIQWQKTLGGKKYDQAASIQQTMDGGYIVAGPSYSNNGDVTGLHGGSDTTFPDYWIVKLRKNGDVQWQRCLGGSHIDFATSIQQTADSGYIVAGWSTSNDGDVTGNQGAEDWWIVKLDKKGFIEWGKSIGGTKTDIANCIRQTTDGGYIVAGFSFSNDGDVKGNHGDVDYWIVKLKRNGIVEWQECLGGSGFDEATSIRQTSDSGYIVAGQSYSNDGDVTGNQGGDYWIVKLDKKGFIQWQKSIGSPGIDEATSVQQTLDGGYIIAGSSGGNSNVVHRNHGATDYWIVKLAKNSNIQWEKYLGGSYRDESYSIQQTADSGYIVAGESFSNDDDVTGNHGSNDYWIVKLSKDGPPLVPVETNAFAENISKNIYNEFSVYPNPAKNVLYIQTKSNTSFFLLNASGKIVFTKTINGSGSVDIKNLPAGNYYLKNTTTGVVRKVIINK